MKNIKILRNTFIIVGVPFVLVRLLFAGTNDGVPNFGNMPLSQPPPAIITFDAPGAGVGPFEGTLTYVINDRGTIAGDHFDSNSITHGFVRATNGTFSTFDAPGGGTGPYQWHPPPPGMNSVEKITGFVEDSSYVLHGYLRAPDGTFTMFDVPGAGTGQFQGTEPLNINSSCVIAGYWIDPSNVFHGFVRDPDDGTIHSFDAPGAGTGPGQGTFIDVNTVDNLNSAGDISGISIDANNVVPRLPAHLRWHYHGHRRSGRGHRSEPGHPIFRH